MDSKLPKDMMVEIVSRTSLRTFDAMRCTSKEINKLTYDSNLVDLYKQRNHIVSGVIAQRTHRKKFKEFVPSPESQSLDLGFLPDDARILASSEQGIIVLERPHLVFYVCKPATKQLLQLPQTKTKNETDMASIVIMDSKPLRYKIFRFSRPENDISRIRLWRSTYCCEIFDSSACELEWRLLDPIKLPYGDLLNMKPVTMGGSMYILLTNGDILKFNTYLEKWTSTFSVPKHIKGNFLVYTCMDFVKYEGKLGLACRQLHGYWEIWMLTAEESWVKTYILNKKEDMRCMELVALYDSDTSIMLDFNRVPYYKFKTDDKLSDRFDEAIPRASNQPNETFVFRSDFDVIELVS